jgi:RecA/RadA recombinase
VYGNPETTTGGNALEFYGSVRLDIRRVIGEIWQPYVADVSMLGEQAATLGASCRLS